MLDVTETASQPATLDSYLAAAVGGDASLAPVAETLRAIAVAAARVAGQIALGPLSPEAMPQGGSKNSDGDVQKALDLLTDKLFMEALATAPVAVLVSEELAEPLRLTAGAPLVVAIDPLDGSSNIDNNVSIGTIVSILPSLPDATSDAAHFMQPGRNQRAAGFVVYGPQTIFVLSIGAPTVAFILDPRNGTFVKLDRRSRSPRTRTNTRSTPRTTGTGSRRCAPSSTIACTARKGGFSRNHNMRWIASMVADAYRIFMRGGVFLYPGDQRKGYNAGRLRMLYEVSPVAFLVEHAGGMATDGRTRILDIVPSDVHERSPLVFGSRKVVETIREYHTDPKLVANRSPLFKTRGLMID